MALERSLLIAGSAIQLVMNAAVSSISPYFPTYAGRTYGLTPLESGVIMAAMPAAGVVFSAPLAALSSRVGRVSMLYVLHHPAAVAATAHSPLPPPLPLPRYGGILSVSFGSFCWAFASSPIQLFAARLVLGIGCAAEWVAIPALLMEHSSNFITAIAITEALAGTGYAAAATSYYYYYYYYYYYPLTCAPRLPHRYMLGPTAGGYLFDTMGFRGGALLQALCTLVFALCVLPVLLRPLVRLHGAGKRAEPASDSAALGHGQAALRSRPMVLLGCLNTFSAICVIGAVEATYAPHYTALLGVGASGNGLLFCGTSLTYSILATPAAWLSNRFGYRAVMGAGAVFYCASLLLCDPSIWLGGVYPPAEAPRWLVLSSVVACSLFMGAGIALTWIPSLPLMKTALDGDPNASHKMDKIAGLANVATSLGEALGPFLGGALLQVMPRTVAARCEGDAPCSTAFAPMISVFAGLMAAVALANAACIPKRLGVSGEAGDELEPLLPSPDQHQHRDAAKMRLWGSAPGGRRGEVSS